MSGGQALGVKLLDRPHGDLSALQRGDAAGRGTSGGDGGQAGDAMSDSGATDGLLVKPGVLPLRSVDDELDASTFYQIDSVGPSFFDFINALNLEAGIL